MNDGNVAQDTGDGKLRADFKALKAKLKADRGDFEAKMALIRAREEDDSRKYVNIVHSIAFKIILCVLAAVLVTSLILVGVFRSLSSNSTLGTAEHYMLDLAKAYGEMLENEVQLSGSEVALSRDVLINDFSGIEINLSDSAYVYVVAPDRSMLYHPTADKIGSPVENVVVTEIAEDLSRGIKADPAVTDYEYRGSRKYAAYYVTDDFILVVSADYDDVKSPVSVTVRWAYVASVVILVIFTVIALLLSILIVKPIIILTEDLGQLARLDFRTPDREAVLLGRNDEIGKMGRAATKLRTALVDAFRQISEQSDNVARAAAALSSEVQQSNETVGQVETAVSEIASGATNQAQETQKATENVIKIGEMVEDTKKQVVHLDANARTMDSASTTAQQTLGHLTETNAQTRQAVDLIYEKTRTTNVSAQKIKEVTSVITSIAEETNLLSLNASIEAARAGEQGRGFAVVAGQIQKLADQSNESAREIEQIVDSLIKDSDEAVATMDEVRAVIDRQDETVQNTGADFGKVKKGIDASTQSVSSITEFINRLDEARIGVVDVVQNLTAIAEENAASTEQTSASTTMVRGTISTMAKSAVQLGEIAQKLQGAMDIFTV